MSCAAAHQSKQIRQNCHGCRVRKALFRYRGVVKADRDHVLCFACFRAEVNGQRAYLLAISGSERRRFADMASARQSGKLCAKRPAIGTFIPAHSTTRAHVLFEGGGSLPPR
jgi:hypothetical protein